MPASVLKLATKGYSHPIDPLALSTQGYSSRPIGNIPPSITLQPQSQAANVGSNVTFTVGATGSQPLVYQWQKDLVNITGASGDNYGIIGVAELDEGFYSVDISNSFGSTSSEPAFLAVNSMNEFSDTPAIGATGVVSTINPDIVLLRVAGDPYFQMTSDIQRVDIFYTHTGERQYKRIIHQGQGLTGMVQWSNYAQPGIWEKTKTIVYDTDNAIHRLFRSDIGPGEDISLS